ncbi:hypothetical protein BDV98DRAFT_302727 [Pterulicium gracile]|uniref:Secreted protein n=1 Tax=Pterulicium gracile TaxID=1884261 RepID=A0A5C3QE05_9AGAR|nr:hypothetical protein BDV98DRAFT_302727 [Pterula gracilis]
MQDMTLLLGTYLTPLCSALSPSDALVCALCPERPSHDHLKPNLARAIHTRGPSSSRVLNSKLATTSINRFVFLFPPLPYLILRFLSLRIHDHAYSRALDMARLDPPRMPRQGRLIPTKLRCVQSAQRCLFSSPF